MLNMSRWKFFLCSDWSVPVVVFAVASNWGRPLGRVWCTKQVDGHQYWWSVPVKTKKCNNNKQTKIIQTETKIIKAKNKEIKTKTKQKSNDTNQKQSKK